MFRISSKHIQCMNKCKVNLSKEKSLSSCLPFLASPLIHSRREGQFLAETTHLCAVGLTLLTGKINYFLVHLSLCFLGSRGLWSQKLCHSAGSGHCCGWDTRDAAGLCLCAPLQACREFKGQTQPK